MALAAQAILEDDLVASAWFSRPLWGSVIELLRGRVEMGAAGIAEARLPLWFLLGLTLLVTGICWPLGAVWIARRRGWRFAEALAAWGDRGWRWWLLPGVWFFALLTGLLAQWAGFSLLLSLTADLFAAASVAGWLAAFVALLSRPVAAGLSAMSGAPGDRPERLRWSVVVGGSILLYVLTFTAMNWGLWFNLRLPHGDSAMYEEHLWNLEHGKGFRSYLDQGLFLGEHIQVIHLLLIPLHLLWPSHLLLELAESCALAITAAPVYAIARRHTGSRRCAAALAIGCLLYFPLQYLDIAIDLKTFRPSALGIPLLAWAIDAMEQRRWGRMGAFLALTLSAQEDFALVIAPLGIWLAVCGRSPEEAAVPWRRRPSVWMGAALALLATAYVFFAVKVAIPWFRGGAGVHYVRYFSKFGDTPGEIVATLLRHPGVLIGELVTAGSIAYALRLLVPLGLAPLFSPTRLLVAGPLFLTLCMNDLSQQYPAPVHHFHAAAVPILLWAAAAGMARGGGGLSGPVSKGWRAVLSNRRPTAAFVMLCALCTATTWSLSPLGLRFWDAGRTTYWRSLYVPDERARAFAAIEPLIPRSARVASTDFVHPRFTHHKRSYDYSDYPRAVANYEDRVPHDTDYIVIDTQHPYSTIHTPAQLRELQREPDQWELLPDRTGGYFIVLKRRDAPAAAR